MQNSTRRHFLADVGKGMLVASVGTYLAQDLGLAPALAGESTKPLTFGTLEPLVAIMQETPPEKLLPIVVDKLNRGAELRSIVAAAALANARAFGGQDYIGFHTFMALSPALAMAGQLPKEQQALPVLKVIYRNASRIQAAGSAKSNTLAEIEAETLPENSNAGELLQQATRSADIGAAERRFAAIAKLPVGEAFNHLQYAVQDEVDVHRVVLSWRAWMALDVTGQEYAHTLLRQSVRYCADAEKNQKNRGRAPSPIRALLPKLLDQYHLAGRSLGERRAEDAWVDTMGRMIASASPEAAADAVAAALADNIAPDDIAEAIALAANELVLRDPGRPQEWTSDGKPVGSVHGDSVGVHASDSANAWRNIARVSNPRNTVASLIVGAYHTGGQSGRLNKERYPLSEHLEKITANSPSELLTALDAAIVAKDQFAASAVVQRYSQLGQQAKPIFEVLMRYGISEDGALHAEKYYHTVSEEFARTREAFRWRQLVALARVTASEYGRPAPGYGQARELLKI